MNLQILYCHYFVCDQNINLYSILRFIFIIFPCYLLGLNNCVLSKTRLVEHITILTHKASSLKLQTTQLSDKCFKITTRLQIHIHTRNANRNHTWQRNQTQYLVIVKCNDCRILPPAWYTKSCSSMNLIILSETILWEEGSYSVRCVSSWRPPWWGAALS